MLPPSTLPAQPARSPAWADTAALEEVLGTVTDLPGLTGGFARHCGPPPTNLPALRAFLQRYRDSLLLPFELPAIRRAFHHAERYEVRELLALDYALPTHHLPPQLAFASQVVGQRYLRRLRPLRDVRLVRRYLHAVQARRAHGWHTLVYGSVLAVYSLPLRQGLLGYARLTLSGFLTAATRQLQLPTRTRQELAAQCWAPVPTAVDRLLAASQTRPRLLP